MDSKDFRLLIALYVDARQSLRSLGRLVSLSPGVVRERFDHLTKQGILQGFLMTVNPAVFDRADLIVSFEGDWTREDVHKVLASRDVAWVAWKVDGDLTVQTWPRDREAAVRALESILGTRASGQFLAKPRAFPPLSRIDWKIIDLLVDDPRIPLQSLVERTALSPKTVRGHLRRLLETKTISIAPKLAALAGSGELVYTVSVFGNVEDRSLREVLGDSFLVKRFHEPPARYLLCRGRDLSEVTAKTHAVEAVPGVESVSITLNRELVSQVGFIHSLVRERIRSMEPPRRRVGRPEPKPVSFEA